MSQEIKNRAAKIFEHYPKAYTVYFTADGSPFLSETDAKTHAKTLEDKEITPVQRQDAVSVPSTKTPTIKPVEKMNVAELKQLASDKNIEIPEGATKKEIIALIEAAQQPGNEPASEDDPGKQE